MGKRREDGPDQRSLQDRGDEADVSGGVYGTGLIPLLDRNILVGNGGNLLTDGIGRRNLLIAGASSSLRSFQRDLTDGR
jgi:hypothetical protein